MRYKKVLNRVYWGGVTLVCVLIVGIPVSLAIRNPHVRLPDFHGGQPPELMWEWNRAVNRARIQQGMINDFYTIVNAMDAHYPFIEMVGEHVGKDFHDFAATVYEELLDLARGDFSPNMFLHFIDRNFISLLGGFGGIRVVSEPFSTIDWMVQPYFYGIHDWQFYDDRFDIEARNDNTVTDTLAEGIAYLRVNHFLPKGYEPITRNPYLRFDYDTERQRLLDFYDGLNDYEHLVIDIRGVRAGFGDYFLPLIMEPLIHTPITERFYAFYLSGWFARRVGEAFQTWYGFGEPTEISELTRSFSYGIPERLEVGFSINITAQPREDTVFGGQVWLLVDSDNVSGANLMYLRMAKEAGFMIVYEENPAATGWATSFIPLPNTGTSLRFNPLYFTNHEGRFLEGDTIYHHRLDNRHEGLLGVINKME